MNKQKFLREVAAATSNLRSDTTAFTGHYHLKSLEPIFAEHFTHDQECVDAMKNAWEVEAIWFKTNRENARDERVCGAAMSVTERRCKTCKYSRPDVGSIILCTLKTETRPDTMLCNAYEPKEPSHESKESANDDQ